MNLHTKLPILTGAMVACFIWWASMASIDVVVRGNGRIITSDNTHTVQHLEGGLLSDLQVSEGQVVEFNDLLLTVENTMMMETLSRQLVQIRGFEAKARRLQAELEDEDFVIWLAQQGLNDPVWQDQVVLYQRRSQRLQEEVSVLEQQIAQKNAKLSELKQKSVDLSREYDLAKRQLDILAPLVKDGAGSMQKMLEKKANILRLSTQRNQAFNSMPELIAHLEELKHKKSELRSRFQVEAQAELNEARLKIAELQESIKAGQSRMRRTEVRSPVSGIVQRVHVGTLGEVIRPGDDLVEIVPDKVPLKMEVRIKPRDRGKVWEGLPVNIKVSAYDFAVFGSLRGRVDNISADTFFDEVSNEYFYRIGVNIDVSGFAQDKPLLPGMIVEADIIAGKKTVLRYLLNPIYRAMDRALTEA